MTMSGRAYSLLEIKSISEDQRTITGLASTPTPDRMADVVVPGGAVFKLPLPLLWQHDSHCPIGLVTQAKVTKAGIEIVAEIAKNVSAEIERAWALIKAGLVRGLSIGFRGLDSEQIPNSWGVIYNTWEWLELSTVTIPANADATITSIKSIDTALLAASGQKRSAVARLAPPGASGPHHNQTRPKEAKLMTIAERIAAFEATRAAKAARMNEIQEAAGNDGRTKDASEKEEFDTLKDEIKSIDNELVDLRDLEKANVAAAKPAAKAADDAASFRGPIVQMKRVELPKGTAFVRMVGALASSRGNRFEAAEFAKRWKDSTPEVEAILRLPADVIEKTAVNAGTTTDTTWAGPLVQYQNMAGEFIEYLRPLTIIGRIQGFRRVPFKIKVPRQTAGASVNWVGEAKVKPLSSLAFDSLTFEFTKIAGIIPLSEELVRFSSPSAEALVRADLAAAITQFMDRDFVDPTKAEAVGVSPASITFGVTPITASGTTAAALRADIRTLFSSFLAANLSVAGGVWIMTQTQALAINLMVNALGQAEFPGLTINGGTFLGFPVVVSENLPSTGGSPSDGYPIIFALAGEIMLADDGGVNIDMSREASLQMETAPDSPLTAGTTLVSLWQHNMIAIKAERYINWKKRRDAAVGYIQYAKYTD